MERASIICPVYNNRPYLNRLIDSIMRQSYQYFECIIINDCSRDGSEDLLNQINDERFLVLHNPKNLGAQSCRQKGFEHCSGDYVFFVDGDDFLDEDYLTLLIKKMKEDQSDLVMCNYHVVNRNNKRIRTNHHVTSIDVNQFPLSVEDDHTLLFSKPAFWNKGYRYNFLKKHLRFPEVRIAQDLSILPILYTKANKISYVNEMLYYYRITKNSISNTYDRRLLDIKSSLDYLIIHLKDDYYPELEFIAIIHYFFQISKALFIKDRSERMDVYNSLLHFLTVDFPNYKQNHYLNKRKDYRFFISVLRIKLLFRSKLINTLTVLILRNGLTDKILRTFDR